MNTIESLKAARRCGTPLIVVRTADPAATVQAISAALTGKNTPPLLRWDIVRGAGALNPEGEDALAATLADDEDAGVSEMSAAETTNLTEFLDRCRRRLPAKSLLFVLQVHQAVKDPSIVQSIWNLRDEFKTTQRTLIGLAPGVTLPPELSQDVLILDEPLPTDKELAGIAERIYTSAQIDAPDMETVNRIVDATLGLAAFPAEQAMAMSISKKGMALDDLWQRKRSLISQTQGLSVVAPEYTMDDIGGVANVKNYMARVMKGAEPPRCIVFIDEGEKQFAGSSVDGGDSSGVSQNFMGTMLTEMQERRYNGSIFVGFPGSAKSMVAKYIGSTMGVPTIQFDLSAMKNALVGSSEERLRAALAVIFAVSQGRAFFVMTCNGISTLPPELKRRFRRGLFFFDLPDAEEKKVIWKLYLKRYATRLDGIDLTIPADANWTGSEISACVETAWSLRCPLREAATFIVPAYNTMGADKVRRLKEEADGKYISASYPGPYQHNKPSAAPETKPMGRVFSLSEN